MLDPLESAVFDMPDYEHIEDERFPPLPPPSSPGRGDIEEDPFGDGEGLFFKNFRCKGINGAHML